MKKNNNTNITKTSSSKSKGNNDMKKVVLVGVGLTATGIAGYFGYQYFKKQKEEQAKKQQPVTTFSPPNIDTPSTYSNPVYTEPTKKETVDIPKTYSNNASSYSNAYTPPKPKSTFPLKRGSKGEKVKQLQEAIISTYGANLLPRYGADGDFGKELANALKKLNYSSVVSESLFNVITGGKATQNSLALQLNIALNKSDYSSTMSLLKKLNNKGEYSEVSDEFKKYRLHGGVRQTLVNGTLNTFVDKTQKQHIRLEFIRIGLKYNGNKWSLDGIGMDKIITTEPTQIWLDGYSSVQVPVNMILGIPIAEKLDFTLFKNEGRHFLVRTNTIRKL